MKKNNTNSYILGTATASCSRNIESTQWTRYSAARGHGWGAEDWNALVDRLCGKDVDKVGITNELNGADRIVTGVKVQTKDCSSAYDSVANAFRDGAYRYPGQKLEVPKGQGEDAIRYFRERISRGEVPGVSDPSAAKDIVIEGHCTYEQAVKVAKAGNLESLKFDVMNQMVTCSMVAGLTFAVTYAGGRVSGMTPEQAFRAALSRSVATGASYLAVSVAVQQFLRTPAGRNTAALATKGAKRIVDAACKSGTGQKVICRAFAAQAGKGTTEAAARVAATKLLRTNMITAAVTTIAVTVPDVVRSVSGKQSWAETGKNALVNTSATCGGWSGAMAGAAAGSLIFPGIGTTIGGLIGGLAGGLAAQFGARKALRLCERGRRARDSHTGSPVAA